LKIQSNVKSNFKTNVILRGKNAIIFNKLAKENSRIKMHKLKHIENSFGNIITQIISSEYHEVRH